jgi:hypothetical protein
MDDATRLLGVIVRGADEILREYKQDMDDWSNAEYDGRKHVYEDLAPGGFLDAIEEARVRLVGRPERLGGSPRENALDAYATFMDMSDEEWSGLVASIGGGGGLTLPEQEGYKRAFRERLQSKIDSVMAT